MNYSRESQSTSCGIFGLLAILLSQTSGLPQWGMVYIWFSMWAYLYFVLAREPICTLFWHVSLFIYFVCHVSCVEKFIQHLSHVSHFGLTREPCVIFGLVREQCVIFGLVNELLCLNLCRRIPEYERAVVLGSTLDMVRKYIGRTVTIWFQRLASLFKIVFCSAEPLDV
jgi:hypothetical protein